MTFYNEDKTAEFNQINDGGSTDVNTALMYQTEQMNGDHTNLLLTECKCSSEEDNWDFNAAFTELLVSQLMVVVALSRKC